jgi:hypothetical protein
MEDKFMEKIALTQKNILNLILDYSQTLGPDTYNEALTLFTSKNFSAALVQPLSNSCVVLKNKISGSTGKQTHIHVTGDNRYFFYSEAEIQNQSNSSDRRVHVDVSISNINDLIDNSQTFAGLDIKTSSTLTKVAYRQNENPQVQVSKTSQDGADFMKLRNNLYVDDLLIFLKYATPGNNGYRLFALGIPSEFYTSKYYIPTNHLKHIEGQGNVSVKTALKEISESIGVGLMIDKADDIEDSIYQELVDNAEADDDDGVYTAEKYEGNSDGKAISSNRPSTNPRLGKSAIKHNGFKCIFASDTDPHHTFMKPDNTPYMEIHHLIPVGQQSNFINKLDTKANLVPVCPLCHRKLHHGKKSDVDMLLAKLFAERSSLLIQSGLDKTNNGTPLTEDLLKSFY